MKKQKLILSSFLLALALTCGGAFGTAAYGNDDDPQGTATTTKTAPAPQQTPPGFWAALAAALAGLMGI